MRSSDTGGLPNPTHLKFVDIHRQVGSQLFGKKKNDCPGERCLQNIQSATGQNWYACDTVFKRRSHDKIYTHMYLYIYVIICKFAHVCKRITSSPHELYRQGYFSINTSHFLILNCLLTFFVYWQKKKILKKF